MTDFFELYDVLIQGVSSDALITDTLMGECWTAVETRNHFGMAMTTPVDTAPRLLSADHTGLSLKELAQAAKSWNLTEAGFGMAAVNAYYNTPARLDSLGAYEPFERYCTNGVDLQGKHIGVVGHLNMPPSVYEQAASLRILERNPRPGDYPDSACDWLLPQCDVVIITASTLVNKTLPRLLELSKNAYTILAGPSCPLCPQLLELGIDRIAGLVVTDTEGMKEKIRKEIPGPPYPMGKPFLLTKERL
ncbi:MAG: DUF364 domain-containing protein [Oscillospiraceae bacterium]|jgi:uncharacterized protein (DUF4213/DUF364 family)|nr:DUF364 domain-containing protein [Oscillospiraceae bacterium]